MEIQNSTIDDLEFIFDLYRSATAYQKERFISHWPEFDRDMVINEIAEKRQWKMIIDSEVVCIWATTFSDPLIWEDKDKDPYSISSFFALNHIYPFLLAGCD